MTVDNNPPSANLNQAMTKWSARTALGLSNSVPGPILDAKDILDEDDIISSEGSDMTDGCGSTTRSTTMEVFRIASPDTWPTAFQFRLQGAKAMTKWSARTALGLSNSVPRPILDAKDILDEDDIISSEGSDMTDGCGSTTRSTTMEVFRIASPDTWPTAFQFRLKGAKVWHAH
ncbi:hypothetical protein D9615_004988 [Tricholomella constricta]|uniref:RNA-dependent RNA polymerase n=1 Tax=Tricholomella constricta TaxID=117010 RepID=A0A8H5HHG9_9AGAR|nr:hypothetical protein D9615_004988 [Tricholomella constricta]